MNEQIRELAREAGFYANPDIEKFEKFAELIVQKCVLISRTSTDGFTAGRRMQEHFGIDKL